MLMNILVAALLGISSPAPSIPPYRWLTASELETLLRGSLIVEADVRANYLRTREEFHRNGNYVRHDHNYEAHGKYTFRDDAVCDQALGDQEVCRRVLIDAHGRYWIIARTNAQYIVRISVEALR